MLRILQICILFLFAIIISANSQCYSGNFLLNTSYRDITFKDSLNGFIVGDKGNLIRTYDKGLHWERVEIPFQRHLTQIKFFNDNDGVISTDYNHLFISRDGGDSWNSKFLYSPELPNLRISDFHFNDLGQGIIIGNTNDSFYPGKVLLAEGFGKTIISILDEVAISGKFNSIHFINDVKGFIAGEEANLFKTEDGGLSWESIDLVLDPFNDNIQEIIFTSENIGYMFLREGDYLKTEDGGETWTESVLNGSQIFIKAQFLDDNRGFVSFSDGILYETSDGGTTWNNHFLLGSSHNTGFYFLDSNYGINTHNSTNWSGSFGGGISKTENSGDTWQPISYGTDSDILDMAVSPNNIIIMSTPGSFYRSDDSGVTWKQYSLYPFTGVSDYKFLEIDFPSATQVIGMVGGGLLLYSNDEGLTWDTREFNFSWRKVVASEENVWFIYDQARDFIRKTTDGGNSWSNIDMSLYPAFMTFTSEQMGFAISNNSTKQISKTNDAGATWATWDIPITHTIETAYFYNQNIAYIGCQEGIYYKTIDGGLSWQMTDMQVPFYDIKDFNFIDENHGIMSAINEGNSGLTYETFDGGQTWEELPLYQGEAIHSIVFKDNQHAYLSGEEGTFIGLTPGKTPYVSPYPAVLYECTGTSNIISNADGANSVYFSIDSGSYAQSNNNNNFNHQWDIPGIHTVSIYAENDCGISDTVIWELDVLPSMEPIIITIDGNTLIANEQPNYQWYLDGIILGNEINQTLEITEDGYYVVESYNSCGEESANVFALFTSNEEVSNIQHISILPNPTDSNINITSFTAISNVFIYNTLGERVYQMNNINNNQHSIDIEAYSNGLFYVQIINSDGGQKVEAIIKH